MSATLLSKIKHQHLLPLLGVENTLPSLPCICNCPVCGSVSCMEVTSGWKGFPVYRCFNSDCLFIGDSIQLIKKTTDIEETVAAVRYAIEGGALENSSTLITDIEEYEKLSNERRRRIQCWLKYNLAYQNQGKIGRYLMTQLCLKSHNCFTSDGLGKHLGEVNAQELQEDFPIVSSDRTNLNKKNGVVMPLWADAITITGFVFFYVDSKAINSIDYKVLRVSRVTYNELGAGLYHDCRLWGSDPVVYTINPRDAIKVFDKYSACGEKRPNLLFLPRQSTLLKKYNHSNKIVINYDNSIDGFNSGLLNAPCNVFWNNGDPDRVSKAKKDGGDIHEILLNSSDSVYKAVAFYISNLEEDKAISAKESLELDFEAINNLLAYSDHYSKKKLESLLKQDLINRSVKFSGRAVQATREGWVASYRAGPELISDTKFVINNVCWDPDTEKTVAEGEIQRRDDIFKFSANYEEIQSNPFKWLQKTMLDQGKPVPYVRRQWKGKLLDLSMAFNHPDTRHIVTTSCWVDGKLILPHITIEDGNITKTEQKHFSDTTAINLYYPHSTNYQELQSITGKGKGPAVFWSLFSAVAYNILNEYHGCRTNGIGIVDNNTGTVEYLDPLLHEIGLETVVLKSTSKNFINSIVDKEERCPFPIYISEDWNTSDCFRKWIQASSNKNCIMIMKPEIKACTALEGGWVYIESNVDKNSYRRFEGSWSLLPRFLAYAQTKPVYWENRPYLVMDQVFSLLKDWMNTFNIDIRGLITRVRSCSNLDTSTNDTAWGVRFVSFLIEALYADMIDLKPPHKGDPKTDIILNSQDDTVFVSCDSVDRLFKEIGVTSYTQSFIREALNDIGTLIGKDLNGVRGYLMGVFQWNLITSTRTVYST